MGDACAAVMRSLPGVRYDYRSPRIRWLTDSLNRCGGMVMSGKDESEKHDQNYYEVAKSGTLADRAMMVARKHIYQDFKYHCHPDISESILDVGVSDVIQGSDNIVERLHPWPAQITAVGLGEGQDFRRAFPEVSYIRIKTGTKLPFLDKSFSIVTANAVLEHLGSRGSQLHFIEELQRVGKRVFISVPNRFLIRPDPQPAVA